MHLFSISRQLIQVIRAFKQNNVMQIRTVINLERQNAITEKCISIFNPDKRRKSVIDTF